MYYFFKSKEYDPTPYSKMRHWLHGKIGCAIQRSEISLEKNHMRGQGIFAVIIKCPCGRVCIQSADFPHN